MPEYKTFLQFEEDVIVQKKISPFRTEWRIAAPDLGIGGSVDFVGKFEDTGSYVIMDWKNSKKLETSLSNTYGKKAK